MMETTVPVETTAPAPPRDERFGRARDVRRHLARGMLTNGAFDLGLIGLTALRGFAVAAFVTSADYGLWGLIGLTVWTAIGLKTQFGAGEKYIQQSDANQEHAFQRAFTAELIFTGAAVPLACAAVLVIAQVTGNSEVIAPGLVLVLLLPATALQLPISTFYRRLDFGRQRTLQAVDPVVAAIVTVGLAIAGAGYWSFVAGLLAGAWSQAVVALLMSHYRIALRYESGMLRQYVSFSAPLLVAALAVLALFYSLYLVGSHALGVAGLGAFTLAGNIVQFTDQADTTLTTTLYPAVCAVNDRVSLLSEIFVKSNRLSLIWAVPFGVGVALFASDLVHFVLGTKWVPAIAILEIMGIVTAVHHVGYNWAAFVKARGMTWPIAISAVLVSAVTLAAAVPLMYSHGLVGLGIAFAIGELVGFAIRGIWITRFFTGVRIFRQLGRAFAPAVIAALPVLLIRAAVGSDRSLGIAIAMFALYVLTTIAATAVLERPLLREAAGYMVGKRPQLA
jgi:O-antigen/teichoic acid export membrane protein